MGNGNSSTSKSKVQGQPAKVASTEAQRVPKQGKPSTKAEVVGFPTVTVEGHGTEGKGAAFRGEYSAGKPKSERGPGPLRRGQHQHSVSKQYDGKKSIDNDDTFTDYIRRARHKIRSLSNIGREQNNPAPAPGPAPAPDATNGTTTTTTTNSKESQKDLFADFIQVAKKKLRTASRIGKNSSFREGRD